MCSFAGGGPSRDRGPSPSFSSAAPRCRDRRRPPAATRAAEAARPTPATVHPGAPHTSTVRSASDGSLLATEHSSAAREVSLSHGASAGRRISSRRRAGAWRSAARSACPGCLPGMQRVTVCLRVELPPPFGDNSLRMAAGSRRAPGGTHHGIAQVEGQGNQPGRRADSVRVDLDHSVCCPDVETADRDGWRQEQRRHLPPGQDRGGIEHDRTRSEAACTRRTYQTCRAVSHSTTPGAQFVEPSAPAKVEAQDGQTREQRRVAHGLRQAGGATRLSSVGIGFSVSRQPTFGQQRRWATPASVRSPFQRKSRSSSAHCAAARSSAHAKDRSDRRSALQKASSTRQLDRFRDTARSGRSALHSSCASFPFTRGPDGRTQKSNHRASSGQGRAQAVVPRGVEGEGSEKHRPKLSICYDGRLAAPQGGRIARPSPTAAGASCARPLHGGRGGADRLRR